MHVTLRARSAVAPLRSGRAFPALLEAIARSSTARFRVLHFSVQTDHLHLIVESGSREMLTRGVQGLAVRCARAVNRAHGRRGAVWRERYQARALRTPRETRHALAYVLLNHRTHMHGPPGVDPRSSGPWFDGWRRPPAGVSEPCPTRPPHTWLAAVGWRQAGGPLDVRWDSPFGRR